MRRTYIRTAGFILAASVCLTACKSTKDAAATTDGISGATALYAATNQEPPVVRGGGDNQPRQADGSATPHPGPPPGGGGDGMRPGGDGMPPQGPPPGGGMPGGGMPPGGGGGSFDESLIQAVYAVSDGYLAKEGEAISATESNQSAVAASGSAKVMLRGNDITTSGNTSSQEHSSFQGLNAGVLARGEAEIDMHGNSITTTGLGANGIFAYGNSVIRTDGDIIRCSGGGGHGIMCSGGGTIYATNVNITTDGRNSAPVATDRGSGTITVNGGSIVCRGQDSPGLYSTGRLTVTGVDITSYGSEVAVIEGSNLIRLDSCRLLCTYPDKWGVMIYQSFSGDAEGADGEFEAVRSSILVTGEASPLFFVTNSTAYITLEQNDIACTSGILVDAKASRWGREGENGGTAVITARDQHLQGDMQADAYSCIRLRLTEGSRLEGAVNNAATARLAEVHVDKTSLWQLTADSHVGIIEADISDGSVANIQGDGHDLYYDIAQNPALSGKTYALQGGGHLRPAR